MKDGIYSELIPPNHFINRAEFALIQNQELPVFSQIVSLSEDTAVSLVVNPRMASYVIALIPTQSEGSVPKAFVVYVFDESIQPLME